MLSIKERVLQIAEANGIRKITFFKELGLSYANFKGAQKHSALGSDAVATILARYESVSAEWLISGSGEMLKNNSFDHEHIEITLPSKVGTQDHSDELITALEKIIVVQQTCIQSQEQAIAAMSSRIEQLEKKSKKKKKK